MKIRINPEDALFINKHRFCADAAKKSDFMLLDLSGLLGLFGLAGLLDLAGTSWQLMEHT